MIPRSSFPIRHKCGIVFDCRRDLVVNAEFNGLQPMMKTVRVDCLLFTCKGCGSSFLVDLDRRLEWYEVHNFFTLKQHHQRKGDPSTWKKELLRMRKKYL